MVSKCPDETLRMRGMNRNLYALPMLEYTLSLGVAPMKKKKNKKNIWRLCVSDINKEGSEDKVNALRPSGQFGPMYCFFLTFIIPWANSADIKLMIFFFFFFFFFDSIGYNMHKMSIPVFLEK